MNDYSSSTCCLHSMICQWQILVWCRFRKDVVIVLHLWGLFAPGGATTAQMNIAITRSTISWSIIEGARMMQVPGRLICWTRDNTLSLHYTQCQARRWESGMPSANLIKFREQYVRYIQTDRRLPLRAEVFCHVPALLWRACPGRQCRSVCRTPMRTF